jgi:crotonobetainyl-CoA:carnitine CoA-transferase CaiB-like acyl-CoA transferase
MAHYDVLRPTIERAFRTNSSAAWLATLSAAAVPCGAVRNIGEVLVDPQLESREMIATLMHPTAGATRVIGSPIKLSDTPASVRTPPPLLGQHTDSVLAELGYTADQISTLRTDHAV